MSETDINQINELAEAATNSSREMATELSSRIGVKRLAEIWEQHNVDLRAWHGAVKAEYEACIEALEAQLAEAERQRDAARSAQVERGDVFADTDPESRWIEDCENACLCCGGSGHRDDMNPITVGIDWSSDAIAEAERRGAERMRERAAAWHESEAQRIMDKYGETDPALTHLHCGEAIRALPLTEGDE